MSAATANARPGHVHDAGFYSDDEDFHALIAVGDELDLRRSSQP